VGINEYERLHKSAYDLFSIVWTKYAKCYNFEAMPDVGSNELSERELDILKLVATGASNKEIAQRLYISSNTVKVHLRNIFNKIGATSRTEAAMYAVRAGFATPIAGQIKEDKDFASTTVPPESTHQEIHSLSDALRGKYFLRFLGIFLLIIGFGVISFLVSKIYLGFSPILPTPTERVQWSQLPGLLTPRSGLAVTNYNNKIITIGGESLQGICHNVESYDPQTNEWTILSSKPTAVTDISAAVIGSKIYIPGGLLANGLNTNKMEIYNPQSNQWEEGKPLPKPLSGYALAVYDGQMYLFGGWDGSQVVNNAYTYDPRNDTWTQISPMPTAREYAGAEVVGGKIYVIGGWDGQNALNTSEIYMPDQEVSASNWSAGTPLPEGRYGMGITNLADIIFVVGGQGSEEKPAVIAISPDEETWGQIEAPIQNGWSFLAAVTVGTRFYVLGGKTEENLTSLMWSYQAVYTIRLPIIR
jgi:DNA-binding CsgD family transcriptional regulator